MELHKVARAVQEVLGALLLLPQDVSIQDTATQALRAWVEACCGSPEPMLGDHPRTAVAREQQRPLVDEWFERDQERAGRAW